MKKNILVLILAVTIIFMHTSAGAEYNKFNLTEAGNTFQVGAIIASAIYTQLTITSLAEDELWFAWINTDPHGMKQVGSFRACINKPVLVGGYDIWQSLNPRPPFPTFRLIVKSVNMNDGTAVIAGNLMK
jgi:hypothetical protein